MFNAKMNFDKEKLWQIEQIGFDSRLLGKSEAIMTLGNGYLGTRSAEEESYINEQRDTFVAGTFNNFDENEVTELPNVPDFWGTMFIFNDEIFSLEKGTVSNYSKHLDLKVGELTREFVWEFEDLKLKFKCRRFVSMAQKHLFASLIEIENLGSEKVAARVVVGINGQMTNKGSQHFTEGGKGLVDGKYLQMMPRTTNTKIDFVLTQASEVSASNLTSRIEMDRRQIAMNYWFDIEAGNKAVIEKRNSIYTSIDKDLVAHDIAAMRQVAVDELKALASVKFDDVLQSSAKAWQKIWDKHPISIESENPQDQLAIRFAQYHLHAMTPAHDERMNIGAKGLSGEGYKGHTFWDTEIFMLPYFIFTHPEIAKKLVTYRYLGLDGAHKKAASNGYQGAQYPWEAAWPTDGEVTPVWGSADIVTGQQTKIWSGFIELHITSDISYAIKEYLDVTGDKDFEAEKGYEILLDTAKFWISRLEYNTEKARYEINDVVGPDEYKEHVNNNAFTNYTAAWNMASALQQIEFLQEKQPEIFEKLDAKLNLKALLIELKEKLPKLFLPQPTAEGIIPQDDTYLSLETLDLTPYKGEAVGLLHKHYNNEQVNEIQVSKQADVLLLLLLFEGLFQDQALKRKNFDYYEPKTLHDSSLSLSTHAILAADLGKLEQSYALFQRACNIDMGAYMSSSDAGIHAASLGGVWQAVVFGYGGVRMVDGKLRIEPHLPKTWSKLTYGFDYQGEALTVTVDSAHLTLVKSDNGHDLSFLFKNQEHCLKNQLVLEL